MQEILILRTRIGLDSGRVPSAAAVIVRIALAIIGAGLALSACEDERARPARLVYEADTRSSGSPPANAEDVVHMGFGHFRAMNAPISVTSMRLIPARGLRQAGPGFLEVKSENDPCEYSVGVNEFHPCPDVVSLEDKPVLEPGNDAYLIVTVRALRQGRHTIGAVRVFYESVAGDAAGSLLFEGGDYVRGARQNL